jgi:hypothetical protein
MNTPIPVKLDRKRFVSWSNSAKYRLSLVTLHPQKTYGLIVQMIWACLVPDDAKAFPTPEHLAEFMPVERAEEFSEIVSKLYPKPKKPAEKESEEEAKNAVGSTT